MIGDNEPRQTDPNRHRLLRLEREVAGLIPGSRGAPGAHAGRAGSASCTAAVRRAHGALAAGALGAGGKVVGILPRFMDELEWGHRSLTELRVVDSMHERKQLMLELADAVVALPGGCGTLEELFEAITWKRLGLYFGPIVLSTSTVLRSLHRATLAIGGGAVHGRAASGHVVGGGGTRGGGGGHPRRAAVDRRGPRLRASQVTGSTLRESAPPCLFAWS